MTGNEQIWQNWARKLHRWGLDDIVAVLLESAGPLNMIGAQMVYVSQPLLEPALGHDKLHALARLLEEPSDTRQFLVILKAGSSI